MAAQMTARAAEEKTLEELYRTSRNQMVLLYGRENCGKDELVRSFCSDKRVFYYRARQASAQEQIRQMGREIEKQYQIKLQHFNYDEYFNRIKSGNASKLVVVIDEFQYIVKKDITFMNSILKLKAKRLYPGPVMIILASSSVVWMEHDFQETYAEYIKKAEKSMKLDEVSFLDIVRRFPDYTVSQSVEVYGILGGVPGYLERWDEKKTLKENVCTHILSPDGFLFGEAENYISHELRELSIYNTILACIAAGNTKLNELYKNTGFSRAKISVYIKNLMAFDVVEKVVSFDTGGWENAKKGVYQISNTFVNFWFHFIYPNLSNLYRMEPEKFYDIYVEPGLNEYLNRYFVKVCNEYLILLNRIGKLPIEIHRQGTWVGKKGTIDIVAQNSIRQSVVGVCNWSQEYMGEEAVVELLDNMKQARITAEYMYLFSAQNFSEELIARSKEDSRLILVDMKEL